MSEDCKARGDCHESTTSDTTQTSASWSSAGWPVSMDPNTTPTSTSKAADATSSSAPSAGANQVPVAGGPGDDPANGGVNTLGAPDTSGEASQPVPPEDSNNAVNGTIPAPTQASGPISSELPLSPSSSPTDSTTEASTAQSKGPSTGAIAGGVVGGILGLVVLCALVFLFLRRRRRPSPLTRALENEPFVVDDRNESAPQPAAAVAAVRSVPVTKGPKTYSVAQITALEKTRQLPYSDDGHLASENLTVAAATPSARKPSMAKSRTNRTVTSVSLTDYDSDGSMESLDEKPLDKGKGKKLPSIALSVSSRDET